MPSKLVKAAVISSSCLLVGGYLLYAGADALMTSSKRAHITPEQWAQIQAEQDAERAAAATQPVVDRETLFAGSKSFILTQHAAIPSTEPATVPSSQPERRLLMVGSKSAEIKVAPPPPKSEPMTLQPHAATQPTTRRALMRGPKSAPVFND